MSIVWKNEPSVGRRYSESRNFAGDPKWNQPSLTQIKISIVCMESETDLLEVIRLCHSRISRIQSREVPVG